MQLKRLTAEVCILQKPGAFRNLTIAHVPLLLRGGTARIRAKRVSVDAFGTKHLLNGAAREGIEHARGRTQRYKQSMLSNVVIVNVGEKLV